MPQKSNKGCPPVFVLRNTSSRIILPTLPLLFLCHSCTALTPNIIPIPSYCPQPCLMFMQSPLNVDQLSPSFMSLTMPFITETDMQPAYDPKYINVYSSHISSSTLPLLLSRMSSGSNDGAAIQQLIPTPTSVAQALEIARDSPEGAADPTVKEILEAALVEIWGKISAQPTTYVMTRDEFAVFNYFQQRFDGQQLAVEARRRYWDRYTIASSA